MPIKYFPPVRLWHRTLSWLIQAIGQANVHTCALRGKTKLTISGVSLVRKMSRQVNILVVYIVSIVVVAYIGGPIGASQGPSDGQPEPEVSMFEIAYQLCSEADGAISGAAGDERGGRVC